MQQRSQLRRIAKWIGLAASALLCALFVLSVWQARVTISWRTFEFQFEPGSMEVRWLADDGPLVKWWDPSDDSHYETPGPNRILILGPFNSVKVPIWILLLAIALVTGVLWWLDRRRYLSGHCAKCGYDLRASPKRCPECGTAKETGVRGSRRLL